MNREFEGKCDEVHELNDKLLKVIKLKNDNENRFKADFEDTIRVYEENLDFLNNENNSLGSLVIFLLKFLIFILISLKNIIKLPNQK